ncbi:sel1 repeat family protein [Saccharobesus litoralis]|uniref:Sel1 repeat family protein n=1 Tax=Saccharobesus litoralis TaxID=2172099 RepID=A0A2S0VLH1_9ALTE|nr:tetratricopeptide repeat protein [Saccharobesus litoralis]AWB65053.1 sel1 repeat family protein [Saccharobesus litoralis]
MKKLLTNLKLVFSVASVCVACYSTTAQANIFKGDELFTKQNYKAAFKEYAKSANIGSPHAYYQMGTMYHKGLGVGQDSISALIWFSLAAEYQFNDSEQILKKMINALPTDQRAFFEQLVFSFQEKFGKQKIQQKYYPELITTNLATKVTFGGDGTLESQYQTADELFGAIDSGFSDSFEVEPVSFGFEDEEGAISESYDDPSQSKDPLQDFFNRPYFLIVDYDVAPDGSVRNMTPIQTIGYPRRALENLETQTFPQPTFNGKRVNFVNRTYMGMATYSKFQMSDENERLYDRVRRLAKKLKASQALDDKYQYAMALLNFTWLKQEEGEALSLLEEAAKAGHPKAQFEYGLKLYREQTNPAEAIHWIAKASQYGLVQAEYRLARILQDSPWVVADEKKALFWYEMAANKQHEPAILKSIELKLLANDKSLHNQKQAVEMLSQLADKKHNHPTFNYLVAVSHLGGEYRDFTKVVKHMRKAIDLGEDLNWDVSAWEEQLASWTTGTVYISEESQ